MAQVYNGPLATIGRRIHQTFKVLEDRITRDPCDISLENESQRFELWAVHLGLYHLGHSSLDYRFRDAPSVFSFAYKLLRDLEKYLHIIKDTLDDELHHSEASERTVLEQSDRATVSPTTSHHTDDLEDDSSSDEDNEDEESFDSYQAQPLVGLAIENTATVIDRLYRLSFKVRNPATRMGLTKAQAFREIDQETGVDLIHRFADYDRNHVEEVFRHYRPKLTPDEMANHFLAQRLAKANTRRRQQFGQWKRHKTKLQKGEKSALNLNLNLKPGLTVPSQPSTATRLDQNKIAFDDNTSALSISTYAVFSQGPDAELPVPQLPRKLCDEKEFECPYCQVLCSQRTAEKRAWKTHVQRDLRPYVCTYNGCKEADQQYDSFKQWVAHETQAHGAGQRPSERRTNESPTQDSFQAHREPQHTGNLDPSSQDSRQCPICLETPASFDHIGLHLWNVAMFSLPQSTGIEEESDQGSTGSVVNDRQSQDSRLTNMKDPESLSMEGEQENNATALPDDRDGYASPLYPPPSLVPSLPLSPSLRPSHPTNPIRLHNRGYVCLMEDCETRGSFKRQADLMRHINTVHQVARRWNCPHPRCDRKADRGFTRRDKLYEHVRNKHGGEMQATHLTIEALKDVPDSLQHGVAVNVSNYIHSTQTAGDEEDTLDIDHGSRPDSSSDLDISSIEEGKIRKAEETLERYEIY